MANKKTREKRREMRHRRNNRDIEKEKMVEELQDAEDEIVEEAQPVEEELVTKEYSDMEYRPPTSWEEMDAFEKAAEQAEEIRNSSWKVSDLVGNILYSGMSPDEKGKAIADVGVGYSKRVKTITGEMKKSISDDDLTVLQLEALIAKDARHTPVLEKFSDFISKAKLTAAAEKKLSDDDFALVIERDNKKIRKYPIHDKAHVRNALARAAQMIDEGGEAAEDAKAALPKIRAAAKRMGIGQMEKSASSVVVEKDANGDWRAVMWPTNNFIDTDGEILSKDAHEEYSAWVNDHMELAPVFTTWHEPSMVRKHQVDFVEYTNGFMLMSAPLTPEEAEGIFRVEKMCDLGMSHGTVVLERDKNNPKIITKYRMVEVSDLPLENAANPFTDFSVVTKEVSMDKKQYLATLLGEERAEEFFEKSGMKQAALREAGVKEKEKQEETPAPDTTPKAETPSVPPDLDAIIKAVGEQFDITGLNEFVTEAREAIEKVSVLEEVVKSLKEGEDDKLAEKLTPPITQKMAWTRPSQSKDNVVKEEDPLVKQAPNNNWFAEAVGVEPLEAK